MVKKQNEPNRGTLFIYQVTSRPEVFIASQFNHLVEPIGTLPNEFFTDKWIAMRDISNNLA